MKNVRLPVTVGTMFYTGYDVDQPAEVSLIYNMFLHI